MYIDPKIYPYIREKPEKKISFTPEAGKYRAFLSDVDRMKEHNGEIVIRFCWELLSHPSEEYRYLVYRRYYRKSMGILGKDLFSWKGPKWRKLNKEEDSGIKKWQYLLSLIGERADIEIGIIEKNGKEFRSVLNVKKTGQMVDFSELSSMPEVEIAINQ
jgi:hypothetical protein